MNETLNKLNELNRLVEGFDKDPKKKKEIIEKALQKEQKDAQLCGFSEDDAITMNYKMLDIEVSDTDASTRTIIPFSLSQYVEDIVNGPWLTTESYVHSLFIDEQTIVHCTDNNIDYSYQEASSLVEFIKSKTDKN